jgi:hypothetical protein
MIAALNVGTLLVLPNILKIAADAASVGAIAVKAPTDEPFGEVFRSDLPCEFLRAQ